MGYCIRWVWSVARRHDLTLCLSLQFSSRWREPSRRQLITVDRERLLEKVSWTIRYIAYLKTVVMTTVVTDLTGQIRI